MEAVAKRRRTRGVLRRIQDRREENMTLDEGLKKSRALRRGSSTTMTPGRDMPTDDR